MEKSIFRFVLNCYLSALTYITVRLFNSGAERRKKYNKIVVFVMCVSFIYSSKNKEE